MKKIRVEIMLTEEMLGMAAADPKIHEEYIASKAPNAPSMEEEVAAIGVEAMVGKTMTVFPRTDGGTGTPFMWDYQIKGFFKDACSMLRKAPGSESSKIKAYKKEIDGLIFPSPRVIPIKLSGAIGSCQRPLRGQTAQGEVVALAHSETVPEGSTIEFDVTLFCDSHEAVFREWLNYGEVRGLGQWRNSGKGRFIWREIEAGKEAATA